MTRSRTPPGGSTSPPERLAGAGINPGMVHGRFDRHAAYPVDGAVSPQDLVTTIYHCLGLDTELTDALGRPLRLCQGEVIQSVLA